MTAIIIDRVKGFMAADRANSFKGNYYKSKKIVSSQELFPNQQRQTRLYTVTGATTILPAFAQWCESGHDDEKLSPALKAALTDEKDGSTFFMVTCTPEDVPLEVKLFCGSTIPYEPDDSLVFAGSGGQDVTLLYLATEGDLARSFLCAAAPTNGLLTTASHDIYQRQPECQFSHEYVPIETFPTFDLLHKLHVLKT